MDRDSIKLVREITKSLSLNNIEQARASIEKYCKENRSSVSIVLELAFICLHFKENEVLANSLLLDLIPKLQTRELVVVFNKITIYSAQFIDYCKKFSHVKQLRPVIGEIFKKLKITFEEGDFYCFESMSEEERIRTVQRLFGFINSTDFKSKKEIIKPLIRKYSHLLPELNEIGYRNLLAAKCIDIFLYEYSAIHRSETIRVQYFEQCDQMIEILMFLKYNQIILNPLNRNKIVSDFSLKLDQLRYDSLFPTFVDLVFHGILLKMCKSSNIERRTLGAALLGSIVCRTDICNAIDVVNDLIYDVSSEIRHTLSEFEYLDERPTHFHLDNLLSNEIFKISGASIFLMNFYSEAILKKLKFAISSSDDRILGYLHLLNKQKFISDDYEAVINLVYEKYINSDFELSWRIIKECCIFYKNVGNYKAIMNTLLRSEHLGLIHSINELFEFSKSFELEYFLTLGVNYILNNMKNVRKSGGISLYFSKLVENENNYELVKSNLFELIGTFENRLIKLKTIPDHILFHVLNIFFSLTDKNVEDLPFYLLLGFSCLDYPSFSIKNCGFSILSSVFRRMFTKQSTIDAFFVLHPHVRKDILDILRNSVVSMNHISAYFCLFIFQKLSNFSIEEIQEIENSKKIGELVKLKADATLEKRKYEEYKPNQFEYDSHMYVKCSVDNCEVHDCCNLLILLNTFEESFIKKKLKKYKFLDSSNEYLLYQISFYLKKKGTIKIVKKCLKEYSNKLYDKLRINTENLCDPVFDFEYLFEILGEMSV